MNPKYSEISRAEICAKKFDSYEGVVSYQDYFLLPVRWCFELVQF